MMISTKGRYALRFLADVAEHQGDGFVPLKDVAVRQEISEKYLEIVVKELVKGGLLTALRGKGGGYRLNRAPDEYNVKSILDGIVKPVCVLPGNHENNWSQSATRTFVSLWGNDRFVAEADSLVLVGINCGPYMKMGDGHVKQEDLHWLDRTLSERVTPGKRVVSFNHYPLNADMDNYREYIKEVKERALYDTGISAVFGDKLLTLSTCEYSQRNGRVVVMAKKISQ